MIFSRKCHPLTTFAAEWCALPGERGEKEGAAALAAPVVKTRKNPCDTRRSLFHHFLYGYDIPVCHGFHKIDARCVTGKVDLGLY